MLASANVVRTTLADANCTSLHCLSGTYEISGPYIFVEQSVYANSVKIKLSGRRKIKRQFCRITS
jgi:hypothetical protein